MTYKILSEEYASATLASKSELSSVSETAQSALTAAQAAGQDISDLEDAVATKAEQADLNTLSGVVDTKASTSYVDTALSGKQNTLTAGTGININNDVISATGLEVPIDTQFPASPSDERVPSTKLVKGEVQGLQMSVSLLQDQVGGMSSTVSGLSDQVGQHTMQISSLNGQMARKADASKFIEIEVKTLDGTYTTIKAVVVD